VLGPVKNKLKAMQVILDSFLIRKEDIYEKY